MIGDEIVRKIAEKSKQDLLQRMKEMIGKELSLLREKALRQHNRAPEGFFMEYIILVRRNCRIYSFSHFSFRSAIAACAAASLAIGTRNGEQDT